MRLKFHHRPKLGMQVLSLRPTFSFINKMQFLSKATKKEAELRWCLSWYLGLQGQASNGTGPSGSLGKRL